LAAIMGHAEWATDPQFATLAARKANEDRLEGIVTQWTLTQDAEAATRILQEARIPAFTSCSNKDLAEDPHLNQAGFFVHLDHPEVGRRQHIGIPWRLSSTPVTVRRPAPCLGEHTDYVLSEVLGYSGAEIARLREALVIN